MGFLKRFIRQEVQGATPEQVRMEEEAAIRREQEAMILNAQAMDAQAGMLGGYTGGQALPPMTPMPIPPSVDREVMKIYLKPESPKNKHELEGEDRYWIFDDNVCTSILTSNLDKSSQDRIEYIIRQARDLEGCDHVDRLIMNLQYEAYMIVIANKARSDLPDHIRERLAQGVGMSFYGDANQMVKASGERPKENRAIFGMLGGHGK